MRYSSLNHALFATALWTVTLLLTAKSTLAADLQVIDKHGTPVPNAIVINTGVSNPIKTEAVVDQVGKRFVPYVSAIAPGTLVRFPNSDNTRHSVYSFSDAKTFELKLYHANDAEPVLFDRAGLVALGCNVHDHMKAYIMVTEYASAISDMAGKVSLPEDFDPKTLKIWHPQLNNANPIRAYIEDGSLRLPISWSDKDPQAVKDRSALENKFKSFKRNAN